MSLLRSMWQVSNSFSQLFFVYNRSTRKIFFSNRPPETIFGLPGNNIELPPFLEIVESSDADWIIYEWQSCLKLKEDQRRDFSCRIKTVEGASITLHFHAEWIALDDKQDGILFLIQQDEEKESKNTVESPENSEKEWSGFIDTASHDLHAPLRKVSVFIERLTAKYKTVSDEGVQEYIKRIETSLDEMRSIIDGLSNLARVSSNPVKYSSCDLGLIAREAVMNLAKKSEEKKIGVEAGSLPVLQGDPEQYKELFENLVGNAIKFSREDLPVRIELRSQTITEEEKIPFHLQKNKKYYKIEVADHGTGFNPSYAEKIFQPFVRLHSKSQYPGNGLGLAICKRIVMNHRGIIYAEGKENEGSRFILILPEKP